MPPFYKEVAMSRIHENCRVCGGHRRPKDRTDLYKRSVLLDFDQVKELNKIENAEKVANAADVNFIEKTTNNKNRKKNGPWRCCCE